MLILWASDVAAPEPGPGRRRGAARTGTRYDTQSTPRGHHSTRRTPSATPPAGALEISLEFHRRSIRVAPAASSVASRPPGGGGGGAVAVRRRATTNASLLGCREHVGRHQRDDDPARNSDVSRIDAGCIPGLRAELYRRMATSPTCPRHGSPPAFPRARPQIISEPKPCQRRLSHLTPQFRFGSSCDCASRHRMESAELLNSRGKRARHYSHDRHQFQQDFRLGPDVP